MFVSFRKVFRPTPEEQEQYRAHYEQVMENTKKSCCRCIHHIDPPKLPHYIGDYGSCGLNSPLFTKKVVEYPDKTECPDFVERKKEE